MRSTHSMSFHSGGQLVAYFKFIFQSDTHTKELEKKRKKLISELLSIRQRDILVFVDELAVYVPRQLKNAA